MISLHKRDYVHPVWRGMFENIFLARMTFFGMVAVRCYAVVIKKMPHLSRIKLCMRKVGVVILNDAPPFRLPLICI